MLSTPFEKHTLSMSVLMTPDKANFVGNVHGGDLLKLMDQVAYACATRYCGSYVVTMSVDQVIFKHPVSVGSLLTFLASVNYTGTTSMEVGIKVISEDIKKGTAIHTNSCFFTMVAMGEDGKPTPVPTLQPETEIQKKRFKAAKKRREIRLHGCDCHE
ncbi:acyl-CoA thioesterase [Sulfurospirillum barnesii]|uniref:Acyl-CoA hydrolase n=1 Tax=Sulfurospirillum barnesii (strain ATCC 700032 / DSM 10660 / SES-3) TaxID=760154 RepID=I3XXX0_SULBS|nr:acyl-CoA thioesterase [Sulfurospirillum barnesii]AFL68794.1 acyl-CoA hydrolase [Sulfurospirillum barnesii SES-3]